MVLIFSYLERATRPACRALRRASLSGRAFPNLNLAPRVVLLELMV